MTSNFHRNVNFFTNTFDICYMCNCIFIKIIILNYITIHDNLEYITVHKRVLILNLIIRHETYIKSLKIRVKSNKQSTSIYNLICY